MKTKNIFLLMAGLSIGGGSLIAMQKTQSSEVQPVQTGHTFIRQSQFSNYELFCAVKKMKEVLEVIRFQILHQNYQVLEATPSLFGTYYTDKGIILHLLKGNLDALYTPWGEISLDNNEGVFGEKIKEQFLALCEVSELSGSDQESSCWAVKMFNGMILPQCNPCLENSIFTAKKAQRKIAWDVLQKLYDTVTAEDSDAGAIKSF